MVSIDLPLEIEVPRRVKRLHAGLEEVLELPWSFDEIGIYPLVCAKCRKCLLATQVREFSFISFSFP